MCKIAPWRCNLAPPPLVSIKVRKRYTTGVIILIDGQPIACYINSMVDADLGLTTGIRGNNILWIRDDDTQTEKHHTSLVQ